MKNIVSPRAGHSKGFGVVLFWFWSSTAKAQKSLLDAELQNHRVWTPATKLHRYKDAKRTVLAVWQRACYTAFTIFTHKYTKINQASLAREQTQQGRGETMSHRQRYFCAEYLYLSSKRVTFSMSSVFSFPLCYPVMERDIFYVGFHTDQ